MQLSKIFTATFGVAFSILLNLMVFVLVGAVILAAAWSEDHDARARARERVMIELADQHAACATLVTDYASWDEALEQVARRRDAAWTDERITQWLRRTAQVTAVFAFDGANRLIYPAAAGWPEAGSVAPLLDKARAAPTEEPQAATGFAVVDGRPMLLSAALLRHTVPVPGEHYDDVLVFAWDVETVVLERLRETTRMSELAEGNEKGDRLELTSVDGRPLMRLGWTPDRPGTRFAMWVAPSAGFALALLSVIGWWVWLRGREYMRALIAAEESRMRLLAAISHDLRQPLQSMALFATALDNEVSSPSGKRAAGFLRQGIERMADLLSAILQLARLDLQASGRLPLSAVPIGPLLEALVAEMEPQAAAKGLALRLVPSSLTVTTDAVMLAALLRNLVSNAIRYTERGKVLVGVRRRRGGPEIWVCDTGIGIADDKQRLIFEEFFQVGNPSRDPVNGVGLGLSIVQRLARLLGCGIHVKSQPGRGSLFSVVVPSSGRR